MPFRIQPETVVSLFEGVFILWYSRRMHFQTTAPAGLEEPLSGLFIFYILFYFYYYHQCIISLSHQHYVIYSADFHPERCKALFWLARPWVRQGFFCVCLFCFVFLLCSAPLFSKGEPSGLNSIDLSHPKHFNTYQKFPTVTTK